VHSFEPHHGRARAKRLRAFSYRRCLGHQRLPIHDRWHPDDETKIRQRSQAARAASKLFPDSCECPRAAPSLRVTGHCTRGERHDPGAPHKSCS
jgi:hypothetical protein